MRATLMLGILWMGLATAGGAAAHDRDRDEDWDEDRDEHRDEDDDRAMSHAERAGYDHGVDAAINFCRYIREHGVALREPRSLTRDFQRGCKAGFDDHIDSNRPCEEKIERYNADAAARAARSYACD
jgi:hypothetical protein